MTLTLSQKRAPGFVLPHSRTTRTAGDAFAESVDQACLTGFANRPSDNAIPRFRAVQGALWILIWRHLVLWSRIGIARAVVTALLCFVLPIVLQFLFWKQAGDLLEVVLACLPIIRWGVWMAATITFWRLSRREASEPLLTPRCLKCGYLLIGLRSTPCPECGDEPTLDELWQGTVTVV